MPFPFKKNANVNNNLGAHQPHTHTQISTRTKTIQALRRHEVKRTGINQVAFSTAGIDCVCHTQVFLLKTVRHSSSTQASLFKPSTISHTNYYSTAGAKKSFRNLCWRQDDRHKLLSQFNGREKEREREREREREKKKWPILAMNKYDRISNTKNCARHGSQPDDYRNRNEPNKTPFPLAIK